jgi:RNA-binding protein 39
VTVRFTAASAATTASPAVGRPLTTACPLALPPCPAPWPHTPSAQVGTVTDIRIITDRHTKKSKGLAYIEFSKQESVFGALALTGQTFMGQAVMVKPAEAEKNVAWEAAQAAKSSTDAAALLAAAGLPVPGATAPAAEPAKPPAGPPLTLRVTNFPPGLGEAEMRQVFEPFGALTDVTLPSPDVCEITFARAAEGQIAASHWNGNELIGCRLAVEVVGAGVAAAGSGTVPIGVPPPVAAGAAVGPVPDMVNVGELDDEEGGLKLDSQSRAALMSRLAGGAAGPAPIAAVPAPGAVPALVMASSAPNVDPAVLFAQGVLGPPSPIPTQCILLKNVWRLEQTEEEGWASEVSEDMQEELGKCGQLLHVHLDTASPVSAPRGWALGRAPPSWAGEVSQATCRRRTSARAAPFKPIPTCSPSWPTRRALCTSSLPPPRAPRPPTSCSAAVTTRATRSWSTSSSWRPTTSTLASRDGPAAFRRGAPPAGSRCPAGARAWRQPLPPVRPLPVHNVCSRGRAAPHARLKNPPLPPRGWLRQEASEPPRRPWRHHPQGRALGGGNPKRAAAAGIQVGWLCCCHFAYPRPNAQVPMPQRRRRRPRRCRPTRGSARASGGSPCWWEPRRGTRRPRFRALPAAIAAPSAPSRLLAALAPLSSVFPPQFAQAATASRSGRGGIAAGGAGIRGAPLMGVRTDSRIGLPARAAPAVPSLPSPQ